MCIRDRLSLNFKCKSIFEKPSANLLESSINIWFLAFSIIFEMNFETGRDPIWITTSGMITGFEDLNKKSPVSIIVLFL